MLAVSAKQLYFTTIFVKTKYLYRHYSSYIYQKRWKSVSMWQKTHDKLSSLYIQSYIYISDDNFWQLKVIMLDYSNFNFCYFITFTSVKSQKYTLNKSKTTCTTN